jgi:hypothetical protein
MAQYRKRPIVVEARQYTGPDNEFVTWFEEVGGSGVMLSSTAYAVSGRDAGTILVKTIQGEWVPVRRGEWIIAESVPERFYPCAADVFEATYEPVIGLVDDFGNPTWGPV